MNYQSNAKYTSVPVHEAPSTYDASHAAPGGSSQTLFDNVPDDFKYGCSVGQSDLVIRMEFVRKVYSILTVQLFLTASFAGACMHSAKIQSWMLGNSWTFAVSWIGTFVCLAGMLIQRRSYPWNMYWLSAFTMFEAYSVGAVASMYPREVVLQASVLTLAIFIALSLFTLQSKYDFSHWGAGLGIGLWTIIGAGLIHLFIPFSRVTDLVIAIFSALVFCGFIVHDTYNLMNRFSPDEYIVASVELYLDCLNLFVILLRILNNSRDN